jgi:hypothetical protein
LRYFNSLNIIYCGILKSTLVLTNHHYQEFAITTRLNHSLLLILALETRTCVITLLVSAEPKSGTIPCEMPMGT